MNSKEEQKLEKELNEKYEQLRNDYRKEQEELLPIEEARKNKLNLFEES
jgi:5-methyltetrahydrofolate--homocysteine methyltransferase